jgi:hypothetical protein
MISSEQANEFAAAWIRSWNSHDLGSILSHYADNVVFYSPFIPLLNFNAEGVISGKDQLREYFKAGLSAYPQLDFKLHHVLAGVNTLTIYYTSVNSRLAAEVFELDGDGKAAKVFCHYTSEKSNG